MQPFDMELTAEMTKYYDYLGAIYEHYTDRNEDYDDTPTSLFQGFPRDHTIMFQSFPRDPDDYDYDNHDDEVVLLIIVKSLHLKLWKLFL